MMFTLFHRFFCRFTPAWAYGLRVPWALGRQQMHSWCPSSALVPSAPALCTHHCWVKQNVVRMIWRFTPKACPWSTPKRGGARGLACGKGAGVTFPRLRAGACSAAYHSSTLPSNQLSAWCQASAPKSEPALRSPLLQEAVRFLMSVDTLHLLLSCLHLAQSGVLPPAIHFTNTWNDRDTKVTLWHLNWA